MFISIAVLLTGASTHFVCANDTENDTAAWPIRAPHYISASFGEPRPGRFHMGVDFKSGGATGKEVYAFGDGWISRVRTSPYGYGKGLYLALDSGKTVVYGHLSGFLPEIEDELFSMRRQKKSYDIDWYPSKNEYRVKKGQIIAYSGDTGSGPPHLHFEIRNKDNVPENPLAFNFPVRDTTAPVIDAVVFIPLDNVSLVDGVPVPKWYKTGTVEPVVISGRVGVAVSTYDRADGARNKLGLYYASLAVDSTVVFEKTYDRISYAQDRLGAFDYMPGGLNGGRGYLSAFFRQHGNDLSMYSSDSILSDELLGTGNVRRLTVHARDWFGNSREFSIPVTYAAKPFVTACGTDGEGALHIAGRSFNGAVDHIDIAGRGKNGTWNLLRTIDVGSDIFDVRAMFDDVEGGLLRIRLIDVDGHESLPVYIAVGSDHAGIPGIKVNPQLFHDRIVVRVTSDGPLGSLPVLQVLRNGLSGESPTCLHQDGECSWVMTMPVVDYGGESLEFNVYADSAGGASVEGCASIEYTVAGKGFDVKVVSPDSLFSINVPSGALYRAAPFSVSSGRAGNGKSLRRVSRAYRVNWGDYPLKGSSDIRVSHGESLPEKSALYYSGNGNGNGWRFLSKKRDGNAFTAKLSGGGYVAIMTDRTAPWVAAHSPKPGSSVRSKRPLLVARLEDRGSGIGGSDAITMTIDGIPIYGEYDFEANRVSYRPRNPLKAGKHTVDVTVTDRIGNEKHISWTFSVAK